MKELEHLAQSVKEMRALQIAYQKAKRIGQVKEARELEKQLIKVETAVDEIIDKHYYTPNNEQSNLF